MISHHVNSSDICTLWIVSDILCLGLRKIILISTLEQAMLLTLSFVNCQTGYIVLSKFLAHIKADSPHTHTKGYIRTVHML